MRTEIKIQQEIENLLIRQGELSNLAPCYAEEDMEMVQSWVDKRVELALEIEAKLAEMEQLSSIYKCSGVMVEDGDVFS